MSFNFQGPSERPIIQGAQNMMNNGGGGNLGYFQGRQKKKEKEKPNIFGTDEEDTFTLSTGGKEEEEPEIPKKDSAMNSLKGLFKKIIKGDKK